MDWYLGAVGHLVAIPAPADPLDASPAFLGAVHESLGGAATVDRLAQPRTWQMEWAHLAENDLTYLELVGRGLVTTPLRLLDPMRRNRLRTEVATGGSQSQTPDAFEQTGGSTPTWVAVSDPPAGARTRGAISWERTTTGAASLTTTHDADRVPLIADEEIRVSLWARGAAVDVSAAVDLWDAADSSTRVAGAATTLHATEWTQVTVTTTPGSTRVSASGVLAVASGQAASTLETTGWSLSASSAAPSWAAGGGAPQVVASDLTHSYSLFDVARHTWQMTLREARV